MIKFNALLILATMSQLVSAHEYWLEPDRFTADIDEQINIDIRIGQMFNGRAYPYIATQSENFFWKSAEGLASNSATTGDKPAASRILDQPGYLMLGYESNDFDITFKTEKKFFDYLDTEGLEWVIDRYKSDNLDGAGATETYYRHAKTLIGSPDATEEDWIYEPMGLRIEIVPEPGFTQCDQNTFFTVLVDAKPIESLLVRRFQKDSNVVKEARTDQQGRVRFGPGEGPYLLNTVSMVSGAQSERAMGLDWVSEWGSFTYACKK